MKRVLLLLAGLTLASLCGFLPWTRSDAAELLPVETLLVDINEGSVRLTAADGLEGNGVDLAEAMEDMRSQAPGELFFGQVSRVIASDRAVRLLADAAEDGLLRLNTAVYHCVTAATLAATLQDLEPYWQANEQRGSLTTLLEFCADGTRPIYINEEGRTE